MWRFQKKMKSVNPANKRVACQQICAPQHVNTFALCDKSAIETVTLNKNAWTLFLTVDSLHESQSFGKVCLNLFGLAQQVRK